MRRVFVRTGTFLVLIVAEDAAHERARELFVAADSEHWSLLTTNAVVYETYDALL